MNYEHKVAILSEETWIEWNKRIGRTAGKKVRRNWIVAVMRNDILRSHTEFDQKPDAVTYVRNHHAYKKHITPEEFVRTRVTVM